jgi:hypothetical protein
MTHCETCERLSILRKLSPRIWKLVVENVNNLVNALVRANENKNREAVKIGGGK